MDVKAYETDPFDIFCDPHYEAIEKEYAKMAPSVFANGEVARQSYIDAYERDLFVPVAVRVDDRLVGFASVFLLPSLHTGHVSAHVETIFVLPEFRRVGAGAALMEQIEQTARERGCVALMMQAQVGSVFDRVLSKAKGFKHHSKTYLKNL